MYPDGKVPSSSKYNSMVNNGGAIYDKSSGKWVNAGGYNGGSSVGGGSGNNFGGSTNIASNQDVRNLNRMYPDGNVPKSSRFSALVESGGAVYDKSMGKWVGPTGYTGVGKGPNAPISNLSNVPAVPAIPGMVGDVNSGMAGVDMSGSMVGSVGGVMGDMSGGMAGSMGGAMGGDMSGGMGGDMSGGMGGDMSGGMGGGGMGGGMGGGGMGRGGRGGHGGVSVGVSGCSFAGFLVLFGVSVFLAAHLWVFLFWKDVWKRSSDFEFECNNRGYGF